MFNFATILEFVIIIKFMRVLFWKTYFYLRFKFLKNRTKTALFTFSPKEPESFE